MLEPIFLLSLLLVPVASLFVTFMLINLSSMVSISSPFKSRA